MNPTVLQDLWGLLRKENEPSFLHRVAYEVVGEERKKHNSLSLKTKPKWHEKGIKCHKVSCTRISTFHWERFCELKGEQNLNQENKKEEELRPNNR